MQTNFTQEQLASPDIASSDVELRACLQCNYCAANCPTLKLLGDEKDSPRVRVFLIKEMLESPATPAPDTVHHLDRCLTCLACMSSCPSSVHYMHLMDHARAHIEENYARPLGDRALRWGLSKILPYPERFRLAMHGARLAKPFASAMPASVRNLIEMTPRKLPARSVNDKPQVFPAEGVRRRRVALLTGCAQKAINTDINDATIRILRRHGCEVVIVKGAGCCGALTHHMGKAKQSRAAAEKNIRAWMRELEGEGLDAIVINTSGCGTVVKDYAHMFRNGPLAEAAQRISQLAMDVSELLTELEIDFAALPKLRVAYHATCSLQFGQRIRYTPLKLLKRAGFTVLEPRDAHACCGFAGTFGMTQYEISAQLKANQVRTLEDIKPDVIAMGNIGCMTQIASSTDVPVVHTVELLDWATGGPRPPAMAQAGG
ncbi:MAG: glycolate oxidase subunit GlcF [Candidatus Thiodiazotropha sp.]